MIINKFDRRAIEFHIIHGSHSIRAEHCNEVRHAYMYAMVMITQAGARRTLTATRIRTAPTAGSSPDVTARTAATAGSSPAVTARTATTAGSSPVAATRTAATTPHLALPAFLLNPEIRAFTPVSRGNAAARAGQQCPTGTNAGERHR